MSCKNTVCKYIKDFQLNLPLSDLYNLVNQYGQNSVLETLVDLIIEGEISFPYKRFEMSEKDIKSMFEELTRYKANFQIGNYRLKVRTDRKIVPWDFSGRKIVLEFGDTEYETIDKLADYFSEENRMQAKRIDEVYSPMEAWKDPTFVKNILVQSMAEDLTMHNLREAVYHNVKEATQFKPTLAKSFYTLFKAKRILDISAGWGDRLLAAMAIQVEKYLGFDPNKKLEKAHGEMIDMFGEGDRERYQVCYEPFETANLENFTCDLIFTSPPYFNLEIYADEKGQSLVTFPKFEDWLIGFLFKSLNKAWATLKLGGYMAIHITDLKDQMIVEPMVLYVLSFLQGAMYRGVIPAHGMNNPKCYRPIWIFQRQPNSMNREAFGLFNTRYGNYLRRLNIYKL